MNWSNTCCAVKTQAREDYDVYIPPQLRSDCSVDFFVASDIVRTGDC